MCTTVPPAKSSTPHLPQEPVRVPGPVRERRVDEQAEQDDEDAGSCEKRTRSAKAPRDERRRDDGELQLKEREEQQRESSARVADRGA